MEYQEFLQQKSILDIPTGFECSSINPRLYSFQSDIVKWALRRGRAAIFADCGLGKTPMQLEWANQINKKTNSPVLILAPLAVAEQTAQEGHKFRIRTHICESQDDIINGINITNYEKLHKFNASEFTGVVLDESSILKNFNGQIRNQIIEVFAKTPYRLACTATPAPNDFMELGNHSEFVGAMPYNEMLSMFFINDAGDTGTWRLKGHAKGKEFWKWLCSWAVMISKPSDLGYSDDGFILPPLHYIEHIIPSIAQSQSFFMETVRGLGERQSVRAETVGVRCKMAAELVNKNESAWVVWCRLNAESEMLSELIHDATEITGSQDNQEKTKKMLSFANGGIQRIVTKPKIAGRGMNWQICNNMVFVGMNDSWEELYQAVRRLYRFGQTEPVNVHIIIEEREGSILDNIKLKDKQAQGMIQAMIKHTKEILKIELGQTIRAITDYDPKIDMGVPKWL